MEQRNITIRPIESNSIEKNLESKKEVQEEVIQKKQIKSKPKTSFIERLLPLPEDTPTLLLYFNSKKGALLDQVFWPQVKKILIESVALLLNTTVSRSNGQGGGIPKVSYDSYSSSGSVNRSRYSDSAVKRSFPMYYDVVFDTEKEVMEFKDLIEDCFNSENGKISVLQYMNYADQPTNPAQHNYGWTSMNGFDYHWSPQGYVVTMPKPELIV